MPIDFKIHPGHHGPQSPIVGTRKEELCKIREKIQREPILNQFEDLLYYGEKSPSFIHLISPDQKDKADGMRTCAFFKLY